MQPKIYFAADHAGFALKNELLAFVRDELQYEVEDCGAFAHDAEDDFTDFVAKAARAVSAHPLDSRAIILGGSGQGEAMLANRFHDVRAAVYYGGNEEIITLSRTHNDANVLSLGARFLKTEEAKQAVRAWLSTAHETVTKYDRRIAEIETFSSEDGSSIAAFTSGITPSLPAQNFEEIEAFFNVLEDTAKAVQIDIVDGDFVPHRSWPFVHADPISEFQKLSAYTDRFEVEVDCMCMQPEQYLDLFVSLGVRSVIVHVGSTQAYESIIEHAKIHGYMLGFAVTNDTDLATLASYVKSLDFVQVMGIAEIGQQGQAFDERTLTTIAHLHEEYPALPIVVDGAVNETTIPLLRNAGATRFAPGSAIAKAADPKAAYKQLARLIGV